MMKKVKKFVSYVLVAALASAATWVAADRLPNSKLEHLAYAIDRQFVGEADETRMQDAAAEAMIAALDDRWSYYISAREYEDHVSNQNNEYVGIGVTVQKRQDNGGFDVVSVVSGGPAEEAGIRAGDIITHADGIDLREKNLTEVRGIIMGEKNTQVQLTVLRDGEALDISVTRKTVRSKVAEGRMLTDTVGYIRIANFHDGAAEETIALIEQLTGQGAEKLLFDVRDNPGGYVHELVALLDHLLPEGPLFRSVSYDGREEVDESDAACLELPMAVLINGNSYSAAELFAAALREYDWAVTVGEPTVGKGYYQTTIKLGDGSAVQLSTGAYTTPHGVNLSETGGLKPDVPVEAAETAATELEDPQILAALRALEE